MRLQVYSLTTKNLTRPPTFFKIFFLAFLRSIFRRLFPFSDCFLLLTSEDVHQFLPRMEQTTKTHEYITAILNGDQALLTQLYRQLFPMVKDLVWKNGGSEQDAKDLFQDTFIVIYQAARRPDFQLTSKFSTYYYGIAWNLWRSRRKKKSNSEVMIPDDAQYIADELPEFDHLKLERQTLYDKAFAQLREKCQKVLHLFFDKIPMREIAENMGYTDEGDAATNKHRCKERLVELIKSHPEYRELLND